MKAAIHFMQQQLSREIAADRHLVVANSFRKRSLFLYADEGESPTYLVKIPADEEGRVRCSTEYQAIQFLTEQQVPQVVCAKPLGYFRHGKDHLFVQAIKNSTSFFEIISPLRKRWRREDFCFVTDRLIDIYCSTNEVARERHKSFHRCFQHGDFWIGNLGRSEGDLVLYDLEFSELKGYPLYDLLHFGLYLQLVIENVGALNSDVGSERYHREQDQRKYRPTSMTVENAFLANTRVAIIMRSMIRRYVDGTSIDKRDALDLMTKYFVDDRGIADINFDCGAIFSNA